MLIPNMILKKCHMYIFVVFCLHVTKSKQISKIIVATCSQGLYRAFVVFPYYIVF